MQSIVQKIFVFWLFIFIPLYSLYSGGIDLGLNGSRGPFVRGPGMWIICIDCLAFGFMFFAPAYFRRFFSMKSVVPILVGYVAILGLGFLVWFSTKR